MTKDFRSYTSGCKIVRKKKMRSIVYVFVLYISPGHVWLQGGQRRTLEGCFFWLPEGSNRFT